MAGRPVAVIVANMRHGVKRQEDFLEAIAIGASRAAELAAFLVGEGERMEGLAALRDAIGLDGPRSSLGAARRSGGARPRDGGRAVLAQEGLSNAVIEAMAAEPADGRHRCGRQRRARAARRARAWSVPEGKPAALAQALIRVAIAIPSARGVGEAGRDFVEEEGESTVVRMVARLRSGSPRSPRSGRARGPSRAPAGDEEGGLGWAGFLAPPRRLAGCRAGP